MDEAPVSKPRWVWDPSMGSCKHCGGPHLNSQCRPPPGPMVIPIGYCCPTAAFLKKAGVRRSATPLDWSRSTLPMWAHVLSDGARELSDPSRATEDTSSGRAVHALYCEPAFAGVELWVHGHDPPSWARRCERLQALLHNPAACSSLLALHIGFAGFKKQPRRGRRPAAETANGDSSDSAGVDQEVGSGNATSRPAPDSVSTAETAIDRNRILREFTVCAMEVGQAAASPGLNRIEVAAVLFVPADDTAEGPLPWATHIADLPGHSEPLPLLPVCLEESVAAPCINSALSCFAFARPLKDTTVILYSVPHDIRNGAGLPLPRNQAELLPQDFPQLQAAISTLFPKFFVPGTNAA